MPATVIAERIGWERGITVLRQRVRELRPVYQPPDPYQRTEYQPGEIGQRDGSCSGLEGRRGWAYLS